ncbi:Eco57I restriction-modification methylase domain-containing protein [Candidatus Gracilibacteria bacterium]|nr:Eco57I restriction-modification methylase domain-containing protein [Candidatus Gracilibacteria bacterium]
MDFQKSYNRQDFLRFLRNDFLKEKFSEQIEETDLAKKINSRFFSKITKLGTALDLDNLIVLEIEHKSKNDARIGLTKDIFKLLRQYELEGIIRQHALVILTNPDSPDLYRLSLLTTTYNDKFEEKLSNPKRFSYLLGVGEKVKTANDFLFEKGNIKDFNDLENRFKVEVVRENFFNDYLNLYIRLYKSIVEAKDFHELLLKNNVDVVSFTKNLLGKIVFLYFIQKKGWFKNKETGIGDNLFFKNIWDDFNNKGEKNSIEKKNYFYNDYLEYIFYEGLNIENRDSDFSKKFGWEIPYLNGGLFKEDYPNWKENIAKISNDVFSNEKENGILDIFNLYNFTIDEDDLYDKEVAIDPEMLGKIFEKMISVDSKNIGKIVETYNEKSSKKRGEFITMDIENWNVGNNNKKLGAFYTPREIVHYMTKESLINYLINNLDGKKEDKEKKVRDLFDFKDKYLTDNDLSIEKIKNDFENVLSIVLDVNKKLKEVKILDPAIGSGAFPMGILHEISTLRYYIYDVLIKNVLGQKDYKNSMYDIKKEIIENNIYGVDIDPGAIDIARLRFWLSLIVDEETPEPLPNFEFKFVCANTLLPIEKEEKQLDMEGYIKDEAKLETLKKYKGEYFNISDKEKKEALKNRIRNYTALNNQQEFGYIPSKRAFQFNEFGSNFDNPKHSHSFFDPSLMMSEGRGFDIVIGNPPYIRHEDIKELKPLLKDYYTTYSGTSDLYCYFYEKGFTLLKQGGILSYITSNKFLKAKYGENIRKLFKNETIIKDIIDFGGYKVFDNATVDSIIFQFEKGFKPSNNFGVLEVKEKFINLKYYFDKEKFDVKQENLSNNSWTLGNNKILELKEKIEKQGIKLKDYCGEPKVGIKTGLNKILIVDKNLKNKIIGDNYIEDKIFKKVIFGKNITKYYSNFNNFFLIFPYIFDDNIGELKNIDLDNFPNTKSYLLNFYNDLKNRATFNNGKKEWFELQQINKNINFDSGYITFPDIGQKPSFSYQNGYSVDMTGFIIDKDDKYLLGLLNSKLIYFYFTLIASKLGNKGFRFKNQFINQLPIKQISIEEQKEIIFLVDEILKITNTAGYNPKDIPEKQKELENKIDRIVYELYGLEKEDIDVIEESLEK